MPGEGLKLEGDARPWRILQTTASSLRLIFDDRRQPKFRWVLKSRLSFNQRHWIEWPVYSFDGVAKAIRHTNFALGGLFLDAR